MEKQEFIKAIKELVTLKKDVDNLSDALKRLEPDFNFICFGRHETLIVKLLQIAMDDKSEWISYWLYDCDAGKENLKVTKDGKKVPMKTPEDLYNCIRNI